MDCWIRKGFTKAGAGEDGKLSREQFGAAWKQLEADGEMVRRDHFKCNVHKVWGDKEVTYEDLWALIADDMFEEENFVKKFDNMYEDLVKLLTSAEHEDATELQSEEIMNMDPIMKMNRLFRAFDLDTDGFISKEELAGIWKMMNANFQECSFVEYWYNITGEMNGKINYFEACLSMMPFFYSL